MPHEIEPVIMGPPGYGSPDPETSAGKLVPLSEHPLKDQIDEDYGKGYETLTVETDPVTGEPLAGTGDGDDVNATDGAKELAEAEGVDLNDVVGTGDNGRITKADVEQYLADQG